ncbi:MAG: hypothetical protein J0M18_18505 [Ignavibacteria bacterium]|nr:hypothetical protein [Ignavibacteria bacterium]
MKKAKSTKIKIRVENAAKAKRTIRRNNPEGKERQAIELYKGFHARNDIEIFSEDIKIPKELVFIGKATELNYQSDKWDGKARHYRHKYKTFGDVLADPAGKMIIITGLNFKIKPEGITG